MGTKDKDKDTMGGSIFQNASSRLGSPIPAPRSYSRGATPPLSQSPNPFGGEDNNDRRISSSARPSFAGPHRRPNIGGFGDGSDGATSASAIIDDNINNNRYHRSPSIDIDNPDPHTVKVVGRYLVGPDSAGRQSRNISRSDSNSNSSINSSSEDNGDSDPSNSSSNVKGGEFSSLRLQGGDITRQLYKWQQEHEQRRNRSRSRSFTFGRSGSHGSSDLEPPLDVRNIRAPGGMRRSFLQQNRNNLHLGGGLENVSYGGETPPFFTRNFIEFLTIYGHFAGEELEEEDEENEEEALEEEFIPSAPATERTSLLLKTKRKSYQQTTAGKATPTKAVLLLLKSFVGTGVLFLPKAYSNGGILFCSVLLTLISLVSYWCFLLLIASKEKVGVTSFGDVGGALYGSWMRQLILGSIVLSQIGFAAAYIVFVSENLQALIQAVAGTLIRVETLIMAQLLIFLPLSMIRDIAKLSFTALIADLFIMLGLLYLYVWGAGTIYYNGTGPDIKLFNSESWTLFIGTAIFTFEGIGLIIPIQESMKQPEKFRGVLAGVMVFITIVFVSMGALQYAAYGSEVKTVIILNLPQDSKVVNLVQLLYSLAIMLSTPLQLFPAIRILENWLFIRSGKYSRKTKWEKNVFRFILTICTAIVAWGGADDLDKFVALIGSFACIPLVYIYPPMLHLRAVKQGIWGLVADLVLCIFGFGVMVYTTGMTVKSWVTGGH